MYTQLKMIGGFVSVFGVINALAAVLVIMFLAPLEEIEFTLLLCIGAFMITSSIVMLVLGVCLWNLQGDLESHIESNWDDISSLKKRIEALEKNK